MPLFFDKGQSRRGPFLFERIAEHHYHISLNQADATTPMGQGTLWPIVFRRKRMKNLRLKVDTKAGSFKLSAPTYTSLAEVAAFLNMHLDWLEEQCQAFWIKDLAKPTYLKPGMAISLFGQQYDVEVGRSKLPKLNIAEQKLMLCSKTTMLSDGLYFQEEQFAKTVLACEFKRLVKERSMRFLEHYCRLMRRDIPSLSVRSMRSRWGSCRYDKNSISIALELIQYPEDCLEYVIVHELCHFFEPSHNASFWRLVEAHCPTYKAVEARLKQEPIRFINEATC